MDLPERRMIVTDNERMPWSTWWHLHGGIAIAAICTLFVIVCVIVAVLFLPRMQHDHEGASRQQPVLPRELDFVP